MITRYRITSTGNQPVADDQPANWVHLEAPSEAELAGLADRYQLPSTYIDAATDLHENPRVEGLDPDDDTPGLVVLRYPIQITNHLGYRQFITVPFVLILLPETVITIIQQPLAFFARLAKRQLSTKPEEFALELLWQVLHQFVIDMDKLNDETSELEVGLGSASRNTQLYELMAMQKSLVFFDAALGHSGNAVKTLNESQRYFNADSYVRRLHDVEVEVVEAQTMVRVTGKLLDQYSTAIGSIVSNNLNIIMKVLTSLTIIMTIPTIVGGIYGMNVRLPFANAYWAFWGIMLATAILCGLAAWWLWRQDYF